MNTADTMTRAAGVMDDAAATLQAELAAHQQLLDELAPPVAGGPRPTPEQQREAVRARLAEATAKAERLAAEVQLLTVENDSRHALLVAHRDIKPDNPPEGWTRVVGKRFALERHTKGHAGHRERVMLLHGVVMGRRQLDEARDVWTVADPDQDAAAWLLDRRDSMPAYMGPEHAPAPVGEDRNEPPPGWRAERSESSGWWWMVRGSKVEVVVPRGTASRELAVAACWADLDSLTAPYREQAAAAEQARAEAEHERDEARAKATTLRMLCSEQAADLRRAAEDVAASLAAGRAEGVEQGRRAVLDRWADTLNLAHGLDQNVLQHATREAIDDAEEQGRRPSSDDGPTAAMLHGYPEVGEW